MPDEQILDESIVDPEFHPESNGLRPISLSTESLYSQLGDEIDVITKDLGGDAWQHMVESTQNDKTERGFELKLKNGTVKRSSIFTGTKEGFSTPLGEVFRQKFQREESIGTFHTHFFDKTVDTKAPTGTFSLKDVVHFKENEDAKVMGMLDIGGAHLLIRQSPGIYYRHRNFPPGNFIVDVINEVRDNDGVMLDAIKKIAGILEGYGIGYYFTPALEPQPDGVITLKRVQKIEELSPRE